MPRELPNFFKVQVFSCIHNFTMDNLKFSFLNLHTIWRISLLRHLENLIFTAVLDIYGPNISC